MKLTPSIRILEEKGIEIRELKITRRNGKEVCTIQGKENGRVSTFQLYRNELLYFDRSSGELVEKIVHRFPSGSKIDELRAAINKQHEQTQHGGMNDGTNGD